MTSIPTASELEAMVTREVVEVIVHLNGRPMQAFWDTLDCMDVDVDEVCEHLQVELIDKGGFKYSFLHCTVTVYP